MFNSLNNIPRPQRLLQIGIALALAFIAPANASEEKKTGKHLFILSGQSNMTATLKAAFEERVADYRQPKDRGLDEQRMTSNGQEYKRLIEAALPAAKGQTFDTVGFIWMQGESDANNRLSEVYEESFLKLVTRLKKDLQRDDLYFVIARINDYARSRQPNQHWVNVRNTQVKLGETKGNAWINTDDLNGGDEKQPDGDIHFPKHGSVIVGQRLADKAAELITQK